MAGTSITSTGITFPDATTQTTAATGGGGSYVGSNYQAFGSSGTFTVPSGITKIVVQVWAGGGGGRGVNSTGQFGQTGGICGFGMAVITGLTPGGTIAVTVGGGGAGGDGANGSTGGTSSFGTYISCTGGAGGDISIRALPGTATFSGVAQILVKNNYKTHIGAPTQYSYSTPQPSITLGGGENGQNGFGDSCSSAYNGGGGGGGYGGGGGGGTNGTNGPITGLGGNALGGGVDGTNSTVARVGGNGGGNGIASNGGAGATGTIYGGGGGGGGGFVIVFW